MHHSPRKCKSVLQIKAREVWKGFYRVSLWVFFGAQHLSSHSWRGRVQQFSLISCFSHPHNTLWPGLGLKSTYIPAVVYVSKLLKAWAMAALAAEHQCSFTSAATRGLIFLVQTHTKGPSEQPQSLGMNLPHVVNTCLWKRWHVIIDADWSFINRQSHLHSI